MKICPHSKEESAEKVLGIFIYKHVDAGDTCTQMNTFDTKVESILITMLNTRPLEQSNTIKAILATSVKARENLYLKLSTIQDEDELAAVLETIVPLFWNMRNSSEIMQEFISKFGMKLIQNINILFQKDLSNRLVRRNKYMPMISLTPKHVIKGIQSQMDEKKLKKKQTIRDIIMNG